MLYTGDTTDDLERARLGGLTQGQHLEMVEEVLIRLGVGIYVICLWNKAAVAPGDGPGNGADFAPEII